MDLNIATIDKQQRHVLQLPLDATVDDLIAELHKGDCLGGDQEINGCSGFLVTATECERDYDDYQFDDSDEERTPSSILADKLVADGGTLLVPGNRLSNYGLDSTTCKGVTLYPVFAQADKQPTVFKADIRKMGFGDAIHDFVKFNAEDKEIVDARYYFRVLLPMLSGKGAHAGRLDSNDPAEGQTVALSMKDDFPAAPKVIMTVGISQDGADLNICCTNLAGTQVCSLKMAENDVAGALQASLCEALQWSSLTLWDGAERLSATSLLAKHSSLTAEQITTSDHIQGLYRHQSSSVRPAGYSASGESFQNMLILEPGRAGLTYSFKGDYKRAQELKSLVMSEARWSIESAQEGKWVVRITGQAEVSRYFVHERCGPDGPRLNGYKCFAMVEVPLEQLEQAQEIEDFQHQSTNGSGWTCGSDSYRCSFFLPMCLVNMLRTKPDSEKDDFVLRRILNSGGDQHHYPYGSYNGRFGREKLTSEVLDMIRHFRQRLQGRLEVGMHEIMELQASCPKSTQQADDNGDDGGDRE